MGLKINIETYPKIPNSILMDGINRIKKNMDNWSKPFFMDVYGYSDLNLFRKTINEVIEKNGIDLKNLIILGTGGSIQTALALEGLMKVNLFPVYSSRPRELIRTLNKCKPEDSIVLPISRAGKTLDVNSTLKLFENYPILGLSSKGPMYEYLSERNVSLISVPDLSGRFAASVCSVGLVPALIGGIDVDLFLESLAEGYTEFKDFGDLNNNYALKFAIYLYENYLNGYRNVFNMPYSSYLEGSAGLFVQEISESSGKNGKGMLGTMQPAPLCQHSVLELLLGGSKGHTVPVLWTILKEPEDLTITNEKFGLKDLTAQQIINYQADATLEALIKQGVPSA
ncbi:MAG: hypothetical protein ACTSXF_00270, partial [Promethearchaeota archaeon]